MMVEDRGDVGPQSCSKQTENLVRAGNETAGPGRACLRCSAPTCRKSYSSPTRGPCMGKGVSLQDFADTLAIYEGSLYVNDFNLFGRTWQVIVQADASFRDQVEDLDSARGAQQPGGDGSDRLAGQHQAESTARWF